MDSLERSGSFMTEWLYLVSITYRDILDLAKPCIAIFFTLESKLMPKWLVYIYCNDELNMIYEEIAGF